MLENVLRPQQAYGYILKCLLQGDPKQKLIFGSDPTWPKMIFWVQFENFY